MWFAAFSPDGTRLVTTLLDKTARLWAVATGEALAIYREHRAPVRFAAFSRDGRQALSVSTDQTAHIWNTVTGGQITVLKGYVSVQSAAFLPEGRLITTSFDKTPRLWDAITGKGLPYLENYTIKPGIQGAVVSTKSCELEYGAKSLEARAPAVVWFTNNRPSSIRLYWIDYSGNRKLYTTINSGQTHTQQTFLTHPWVVTDSDGKCICLVMPRAFRSGYVVEGDVRADVPG